MTTILFNYSYPKWEEIPDIDLYLDQVLLYVNKVCAPFISKTDKGLTASMVNNYVKHGYLPKPDKKKYKRQQVARLIAITTLKTVFSIQEIAATLNLLQSQADSADLYNSFVDFLHEEKNLWRLLSNLPVVPCYSTKKPYPISMFILRRKNNSELC